MSNITDRLENEHATIERVLDIQKAICRAIEAGAEPPIEELEDTVAFLRDFADGRHHEKEESVLFPALREAGLPHEGGPIAVMLDEHERGRALILRMLESLCALRGGRAAASHDFCEAARLYGRLLRSHIQKENTVLFPMAEQLLDEGAKAAARERFDTVDAAAGDPASRHGRLLHALA